MIEITPDYCRGFMRGIERAMEAVQSTEEQVAGRLRNVLMQALMDARPEDDNRIVASDYSDYNR